MCGRTAQGLAPAQIRQHLDKTLPSKPAESWIDEDKYRTSYNVAPTRYQPIVRADAKTNSYVVHMMRWGLIPRHTTSMPDYSSVLKSINARDDSLFTGPTGKAMFSHSKNFKRCILLAEGFYEWRRRGKERVPFYTKRRDGNLMLMAAIYDVAQIQGQEEPMYTYATITTNASPQLDWLHDRMPVLIPNNDHEKIRAWLDPHLSWNSALETMLKPCDEFQEVKIDAKEDGDPTDKKTKSLYALETYQVDEKVNSVKNDSQEFTKPWISSSNKKTLSRFFMAKPATPRDPIKSPVVPKVLDNDDILFTPKEEVKGDGDKYVNSSQGSGSATLSSESPHKSDAQVKDEDTGDFDDFAFDEELSECDPDVSMRTAKPDEDEVLDPKLEGGILDNFNNDEEDEELRRIMELSRREHEQQLHQARSAYESPENSSTPIDQPDQEDDEMKKALELSRLQAIADGHNEFDPPIQGVLDQSEATETETSEAHIQSEADTEEELRRKEQEEFDRAIAASLQGDYENHDYDDKDTSLVGALTPPPQSSSTSGSASSMVSPGSDSMNPTTPTKKRKSSFGPQSIPPSPSGKKGKPNQAAKITDFFRQAQ
ncbi:hypothetical protein BGW38_001346 [Lunasporangiospora selenospora]|uniref:Abasic site processing protein n=1 Tax=Lunasporangiospora selenospora TaxID=979761 RepID=A0A9P6KE70_9FUNG|nr:hypothetical protein BGW38_001346 [Lunasporangiospora selenospora]